MQDLPGVQHIAPPSYVTCGHFTTDNAGSSVATATVEIDLLLGSDKSDGAFLQPGCLLQLWNASPHSRKGGHEMELAKQTSVWLHDRQGKAWNDNSENIEHCGHPNVLHHSAHMRNDGR
jgi:hypothetical protein